MNSRTATREPFTPEGSGRPVLVVFAPGLDSVARGSRGRFPALERLLGGSRRSAGQPDPWSALAAMLGGSTERWPIGPVSFLGEGGAPRSGCLRVSPVGRDPEGHGVAPIPASELEISPEEARKLSGSFDAVLGRGEIVLHAATPSRWYLDGLPDWRGGRGPFPAGPLRGEAGLLRLISETEMLFFDDPVNRARADRGRPVVGGIHPWGGGMLPGDGPVAVPAGWGREPYLAGLWRLAGAALADDLGSLCDGGGVAWPVGVEDVDPMLPGRLESELAEPALAALAARRIREVRLVTAESEFRASSLAVRLPWRRRRSLAELVT